jgi:DNA gyrase/topoisomerase IV subunit A
MEFNRDTSILALQAYQREVDREISICDLFGGSGIRGIRYKKEIDGVGDVAVNDISPLANEFTRINANGKIAVGLKENDELIDVKLTNGEAEIFIASSNGKVVRFNENDIRAMGRTASGVTGINVGDGEVVGVATSLEGKYILVISEYGYGKMSAMEDYRLTKRGSQGVLTIKTSDKNGNLAKIVAYQTKIVKAQDLHSKAINRNTYLKNEIQNFNSMNKVESIARNNLKMAAKDEILIIINQPTNPQNEAEVIKSNFFVKFLENFSSKYSGDSEIDKTIE